jgi:hypothetical protein
MDFNNLFKKSDKKTTNYWQLNDEQKKQFCQRLDIYIETDREIFKEIEQLFKNQFGNHDAIDKISCGLAPMLGPYNCIKVFIGKNRKRLDLPDYFQGFPIYKIYESKSKSYKLLLGE